MKRLDSNGKGVLALEVSWTPQHAEAEGFPRDALAIDNKLKYRCTGFKKQSHSPSLI